MTPSTQEYQLIGDIYDAALDGSRWPQVMKSIADLCQARSTIITGMDTLNPGYNILTPHNLSEACLTEYRQAGWDELDMKLTGAAFQRLGGVGTGATIQDLFGSYDDWKQQVGDYYQYCRKWNMSAQMGVMLELADFRWCCLGVHRTEEEGYFDHTDVALLNRIGVHLRRGLQIHRQLSLTRQHNAALYAMLDRTSTGIILINLSGRIAYANNAAEQALRCYTYLRVNRDGLGCQDREQNQRLQALIRGAIETSQRDCQGETGGVIGLTHPNHALPLMLSVLPLSSLDAWQDLRSDNIAAAVFITDPDRGHRISEKLLLENFELTPREIEVCQQFVNTPVLTDLAPQVGLTMSSLRTVLKNIYEKTGQHSQAELMRLLMGMSLEFQHIR
ncbi:MAG TPA: hypothetical protein VFW42_06390 [Fluviicoccus sp.]|nr:hypothetical protein [Fluviicoccus sp.]